MASLYRTPLHPTQTVASFVSNLAAVNGARTMRDFCRHMEILKPSAIFEGRALLSTKFVKLEMLAELTGVDPNQFNNRSFERLQNYYFTVAGQKLPRKLVTYKQFRYCPACILADIDSQTGLIHARSFVRIGWHVKTIYACPFHRVPLVCSERKIDPGFQGDLASYLRSNIDEAIAFHKASKRQTQLEVDNYQWRRLSGQTGHSFLDSLPFYVAVGLTEVVGGMRLHGLGFRPSRSNAEELYQARKCGFEIAAGGIDDFNRFLAQLLSEYWNSRQPSGPERIFGALYRWLEANVHNPDFAGLCALLKGKAVENLPLGPGDSFLGDIDERRVHSVHSAAKAFRVHPKRLRKLLEARGVIRSDQAKLSDARVVFDAKSSEPFMKEVSDTVSLVPAASIIGATSESLKRLAHAGYIDVYQGTDNKGTLRPRYSRIQLETLRDQIYRRAKPVRRASKRFSRLENARRITHSSWEEVIKLILEDRLSEIQYEDYLAKPCLSALMVNVDELQAKVKLPDHGGISLRDVERRLGTTTSTVTALVQAGILPTSIQINPINRCKQTVISRSDLVNFIDRYVSLHSLAKTQKMHIARMRELLHGASIEPAFDLGDKVARYYERDQVRIIIPD